VGEEPPRSEVVLSLQCPDRVGIVRAVAGFLADRGVNILESKQFFERSSGLFFMRVQASLPAGVGVDDLRGQFGPLAEPFAMTWQLHDLSVRPRMLILVSRLGHCLNDLLYRHRIRALPADIAGIASNHEDFRGLADTYGLDYHYLPVTAESRPAQEEQLRCLVDDLRVDLVVLARYMQILSAQTVAHLEGRAINIHHSFLPSFRGARPYHQAHERGVKLIGATAHYVTTTLDEGPIIEQEVVRVDHSHSPEDMVALGRDIECVALARAVRWHLEHRVMRHGQRTVVFR
jgi:formyltetrahydrofolate deformylase